MQPLTILLMKTNISFILLLFFLSAQAQKDNSDTTTESATFPNCNCAVFSEDFVGKFTMQNDRNQNFKMNLRKIRILDDENTTVNDEILIGEFYFKENKYSLIKMKQTTTDKQIQSKEFNRLSPQIISFKTNPDAIFLTIKDDLKNKSIIGKLRKLNDGKYSLTLTDKKDMNQLDFHQTVKDGFSLPQRMILTKDN